MWTLEMAREVDPSGDRTLGILTKPDLVDKGSEPQVNTTAQLSNQILLHYMLQEFADKLQAQMLLLLQEKESLNVLLMEKEDLARERQNLKEQIKRLHAAQQRLARFPC
ncbi:interferon-induced GTP-binding protein Mx3-like [Dendropsophus ebraccatus]|uniref:interferon-induced GTP-binding protein Mx3-like n=1 Tax=Dendropsophus ebraccatus TaxID=150705 RepID=UPI0038311F7B